MAEEFARNRQYEYRANSNLVLEADRDARRRGAEPTGEVETLWGRMGTMKMGDRAAGGGTVKTTELDDKMKKSKAKRDRQERTEKEEEKKRSVRAKVTMAGKGSTVMTETSELDSAT